MLISGIMIGFVFGAAAMWGCVVAIRRPAASRRDNDAVAAYLRRKRILERSGHVR